MVVKRGVALYAHMVGDFFLLLEFGGSRIPDHGYSPLEDLIIPVPLNIKCSDE